MLAKNGEVWVPRSVAEQEREVEKARIHNRKNEKSAFCRWLERYTEWHDRAKRADLLSSKILSFFEHNTLQEFFSQLHSSLSTLPTGYTTLDIKLPIHNIDFWLFPQMGKSMFLVSPLYSCVSVILSLHAIARIITPVHDVEFICIKDERLNKSTTADRSSLPGGFLFRNPCIVQGWESLQTADLLFILGTPTCRRKNSSCLCSGGAQSSAIGDVAARSSASIKNNCLGLH